MLINRISINRNIIAAVILFALCLLSYGNVFQNEFLMDDYRFYFSSDCLAVYSIPDLFIKGFQGLCRPVGLTYLKTQMLWFGRNPVGYHICSLILFYSVCLLFFVLVHKLSQNFKLSLLAVCLFVVHPINNFLLNYKTASSLTLFILFMQLSTLFFLLYLHRERAGLYIASLLCYAFALFCHEMSFILPVFLFLILYFLKDMKLRKKVLLCLWYVIPFLVYIFLRTNIAGHIGVTGVSSLRISPLQFTNTLMKLIFWYLSKLVVPANILFTWDERIATDQLNAGWIFMLLFLAGSLTASFFVRKKNIKNFGYALFITGFIPVSLASFVYTPKIGMAAIEPHWFVYSSMGFFILAASVLLFLRKFIHPKIGAALLTVLVVSLGIKTRVGNVVWKRPSTFCTYWLETNSLNGAAWHCLADDYKRKNDKGLDPSKYTNCTDVALLGWAYHIQGVSPSANAYYLMALDIDNKCIPAYYGLGLLYYELQSYVRSNIALNKAVTLKPEYYPAYTLLKDVFLDKGGKDNFIKIQKILKKEMEGSAREPWTFPGSRIP